MKKILLTAAVVGMFAISTTANAACTASGYVERVTTMPGAANSYIYVRPSSLTTYTRYVATKDSKLIDAALNAVTSRTRVVIKGNAAVCPTVGNKRYAGVAQYLVLAP